MRRLLVIFWILGILSSCEDVIDVDLPDDDELVVIEGWVTNQLQIQTVKISRTQNFNEQGDEIVIENAEVTVFAGNNPIPYHFSATSNSYESDSAYRGVSNGTLYGLRIVIAGDTLGSTFELMPEAVEIQSITFDFFERQSEENPNIIEQIYFPSAFSQDPSGPNFYRYVLSRNGQTFSDPNDIELLDDSAIDGNFFFNEFRTFNYDIGDTATIELRNLNQPAFDFLNLLKSQTTSLGTSAGTSPASINGNLENQTNPEIVVLGYFGCYASSSMSMVLN